MERMIFSDGGGFFAQFGARLGSYAEQTTWELGRARRALTRRFGIQGWGILLCILSALLFWFLAYERDGQLQEIKVRLIKQKTLAEHAASEGAVVDLSKAMNGRARLKAFDDYLLPHQDIPAVVQEVLRLAEKEGVSIQRGEYRPQVENAGGFLRYHMTLPVNGPARAIHQFMQAVLLSQKNIALENVQFKRERIDSPEIEVRIQWVLFAHLPVNGIALGVAGNAEGEARK